MKTLTRTLALAGSVALALSACAPKEKEVIRNKVIAEKATMDANELTEAGEQLVSPYTFMLADKVFDMALEKDGNNKKALFYKNFLKRMMVMKGLLKRVRPYAIKNGDVAQLDKTIRELPLSPLRDFVLAGEENIKTAFDIQTFLIQYTQAVVDFRSFLKANQGLELTLNMNPYVFQDQLKEDSVKNCVINENSSGRVDVDCDFREIAIRKVNSADMIALTQIVSGEVLYYAFLTSYSVEGIERIQPQLESNTEMTAAQKTRLFESVPTLGKLNKGETFSLIRSLGVDYSAAAKWAIEYQNSICPKGSGSDPANQRKGHLISNGLCIENMTKAEQDLALLDQTLAGVISHEFESGANRKEQVSVDAFALSRNPVQDLKSLLPNKFNACGKATSLKDKTFGGLLPDGDGDRFVDSNCWN